ncbi:CLUMA_CG000962, isoform A [Clunio marinus]|uniref:CLUMA_CG000962, isoform A n=1 Tax=Clunio marinus TaxID=568069 RepID=A0A1J1HLP5_9DIPT|nr:CLUMA_CG000962, isoform A [Clunio marinus]
MKGQFSELTQQTLDYQHLATLITGKGLMETYWLTCREAPIICFNKDMEWFAEIQPKKIIVVKGKLCKLSENV